MDIFLNAAQQIPEYKKLDKYLDDHNTLPALVTGVSHIHKAHIIGALLQKPKLLPVLVIAESEAESQRLSNDINMMYGRGYCSCCTPRRSFCSEISRRRPGSTSTSGFSRFPQCLTEPVKP